MASKGIELKKSTNTKSILSQSNGTAEKTSPKSASALSKSPTNLKISPKNLSVKINNDSVKSTNGTGIKKMDSGSPPKVARSPSAKSITPPAGKSSTKTNGLERENSQGDCATNLPTAVKSDLIVDNGVVHSNGNCEAMLSVDSKPKENHLESSDNKEECVLKNGLVETNNCLEEIRGDCAQVIIDKASFQSERDLASGDKACVLKDKCETSSTAIAAENDTSDEKNETFEDAISESNDSVLPNGDGEKDTEELKGSPESTMTNCSQCTVETAKLALEGEEVTKQSIRSKVWDHLDENDLVVFPRPCQGRIPNFKGAPAAAEQLIALNIFKNAKTVKVNPDKPQEMVRFYTLEFGKRLVVQRPRLLECLLQAVVPPSEASKYQLQQASQRYGMKKWSRPISLDEKIKIDLIVLGSVVVDRKGHRLGKGEGFADLEFAMLMKMNAIDENTVIVTTVHDDQIYDELPEHLFKEHDVPVDWIITPTQIIEIKEKLPRPSKILWNILSNRRILEIPTLQKFREEELSEGQECTLKEVDSDVEEKPYMQRFARRRRFNNYSRSTGDPVRDNKMYGPAPPRQYYYRVPRGRYMQQPPPPNRINNYGPPPMMRNEPRHVYYQEQPYSPKQTMNGRPQRMREARPRSMSRGNRQMNRAHSMGRPQSHNRSRSMNRSLSMNRPNGPQIRMNPRQNDYHQTESQYSPHLTKSVEVQTTKSRPSRTYIKRRKAPIEFSLRVRNIGMGVRVRDLKVALSERGVKPRDITWRGYKGFAFLHFVKQAGKENSTCLSADEVIKTLKDLPLPPKDKKTLVIEPLLSKTEEGGEVSVSSNDENTVLKETTNDQPSSENLIAA